MPIVHFNEMRFSKLFSLCVVNFAKSLNQEKSLNPKSKAKI